MEKIWLRQYPPGIPSEIHPEQYASLPAMFEEVFVTYAKRPAFYGLGITLTFRQLREYAVALAAWFQQELKLQKGDRVAIMLPNVLQYPVTLFAALYAGLPVVNINPLYTAHELSAQLRDSGATTIVVLSLFAATVEQVVSRTPLKHIVITQPGDLLPAPRRWLTNFYMRYIRRAEPRYHLPAAHCFLNALQSGKKYRFQPVDLKPQDIAFLQYTGGTTGVSKGAMLTHRNMVANVLQAEAWFSPIMQPGHEIIITALPLYHIFSLTANCFFIAKAGGLNVLISNPRDVAGMITEMRKFRFTAITGVNTLFNALLSRPSFATLDFSALKLSLGGGMAVQRVVAEKWQQVTGVVLLEAYGLTETSPCVTSNPCTVSAYNGTVGVPFPSTEVAVLDDQQQEVASGTVGELAVRGPQVMAGYWNNPAETARVFAPGHWLLTGDMVSIDDRGYIAIRERKKDMIIVSGFNVYPNEVEDILAGFPGVREVAVVGIPDPHSGEAVKAYVVREQPDITADDLIHYSQQNLTGYKVPRQIEFCTELPKSNVGKILRRALRTSAEEKGETTGKGGKARTAS